MKNQEKQYNGKKKKQQSCENSKPVETVKLKPIKRVYRQNSKSVKQ